MALCGPSVCRRFRFLGWSASGVGGERREKSEFALGQGERLGAAHSDAGRAGGGKEEGQLFQTLSGASCRG